jgi:hypothetical protein
MRLADVVACQVEERLAQQVVVGQLKCDQQAADAAVAVEELVDRFELHVRERRLDQRRRWLGLIVQEPFKVLEALVQFRGWRRHEHCVAGAGIRRGAV